MRKDIAELTATDVIRELAEHGPGTDIPWDMIQTACTVIYLGLEQEGIE